MREGAEFRRGFYDGAKAAWDDIKNLPTISKELSQNILHILSNPAESIEKIISVIESLPDLPEKIFDHISEKYEEYQNLSEEEKCYKQGKFIFEALIFYFPDKYLKIPSSLESLHKLGFAAEKVGERAYIEICNNKILLKDILENGITDKQRDTLHQQKIIEFQNHIINFFVEGDRTLGIKRIQNLGMEASATVTNFMYNGGYAIKKAYPKTAFTLIVIQKPCWVQKQS